jgi:integrase
MAINIRCPNCTKNHKLNTSKCSCGNDMRANRKYKVSFKFPNGRWKYKQVDTLDMARKVEAKFRTQAVEFDVFGLFPAPRIEEVWTKYIRWAKGHKRSWADDEERWRTHILPHINPKLKLDKLTPQDIEMVLNKMNEGRKRPYAPATVKRVFETIRRLINWSIKRRLFNGPNPCNALEMPKFDNTVTNVLSRDEVKRLLDFLDSYSNERTALVVRYALFSGKRRGEILGLRWEDVDFENGLVTYRSWVTKNGTTQTLPVNSSCLEVLRRCKELEVSEWVFPDLDGKHYNRDKISNSWRWIREKVGLTIRFHDLRHTYASYLASTGEVDIYTLKELLGHKCIEMTQRYAHLTNSSLRKATNMLDDAF